MQRIRWGGWMGREDLGRVFPLFKLRDADKLLGLGRVDLEDFQGFGSALGVHVGEYMDDGVA